MVFDLILHLLVWVICWFVPAVLALGLIYFLLSLPLRRQERARFFLDLLDTCLSTGQAPERGIVSLSQSRDYSMGVRFHWLAAVLETGVRFQEALDQVPHFLPPRIRAMLQVGAETGDLARVLPACRYQLSDGLSQARGASNYLIVLVFALTPVPPLILLNLAVFVFPKFFALLKDMEIPAPPLLVSLTQQSTELAGVIMSAVLLLYAAAFVYIGGPRVTARLQTATFPLADWVAMHVPWKRRRLLRDFSSLLALLLDQGLPEGKALRLAARGTANRVLLQRAEQAIEDLQSGRPLPEALRRVDDAGELQWRLRNAGHARRGFLESLRGWLEALDARAFQQEQATAQIVTSALVLFNGLLVGLVIAGVFQSLVAIIQMGVLW